MADVMERPLSAEKIRDVMSASYRAEQLQGEVYGLRSERDALAEELKRTRAQLRAEESRVDALELFISKALTDNPPAPKLELIEGERGVAVLDLGEPVGGEQVA